MREILRRNLLLTGAILVLAVSTYHAEIRAELMGQPDNPFFVRTDEAVSRFHAGIDRARYNEVCEMAETNAFSSVTGVSCPEYFAYFHQKLGREIATKCVSFPHLNEINANSMVLFVATYETRYEHGLARERFEWRIQGRDSRLVHYSVEAPALSQ